MGSTRYTNKFSLNLKFNILDLLFSGRILERERERERERSNSILLYKKSHVEAFCFCMGFFFIGDSNVVVETASFNFKIIDV